MSDKPEGLKSPKAMLVEMVARGEMSQEEATRQHLAILRGMFDSVVDTANASLNQRLQAENAELRALLLKATALLDQVNTTDPEPHCCPICAVHAEYGHDSDCELEQFLYSDMKGPLAQSLSAPAKAER